MFAQIFIIDLIFVSCYFHFKSSPADKIKKEWTKGWVSRPYREWTDAEIERMMGKPKNIIDIDYEIDNGSNVYFEIIPTKNVNLNVEG